MATEELSSSTWIVLFALFDSEGGKLKGTRMSVESGSPYVYGVLDNGYRYDLSVEEAAELSRRAIYHATF